MDVNARAQVLAFLFCNGTKRGITLLFHGGSINNKVNGNKRCIILIG